MSAGQAGGRHTSEFRYDGLDRRVRAVEKENGVEQSNVTFIWDGTQIVQKRASDGSTIQRNYFSNGFSAHSAPSAVQHYYYTKDHLGSIREVVASNGTTVEAVYDYSPWGEVSKVAGSGVESDFLYTGHFYHSTSDLHLTLYRAYDPELGMWLSRDPLESVTGELAELLPEGPNLYAYAGNNPTNWVDTNGLYKDIDEIMDNINSGKVGNSLGDTCFSDEEIDQAAKDAKQTLDAYEFFQFGGASSLVKNTIKGGKAAALALGKAFLKLLKKCSGD